MVTDSRGRWLLLQVLQLTTAVEVAARLRVSDYAVTKWACGLSLPNDHHREILATIYRIPRASWDEQRLNSRQCGRNSTVEP